VEETVALSEKVERLNERGRSALGQGGYTMFASAFEVQEIDQDSRFDIEGEFDGLQTFKEIRYAMPPVGCVDRLILDFSHVPHVNPLELYALLVEMAAVPRFNGVEISLKGLRFNAIGDWSGSVDGLIASLQEEI
jgi:hypothetical protein